LGSGRACGSADVTSKGSWSLLRTRMKPRGAQAPQTRCQPTQSRVVDLVTLDFASRHCVNSGPARCAPRELGPNNLAPAVQVCRVPYSQAAAAQAIPKDAGDRNRIARVSTALTPSLPPPRPRGAHTAQDPRVCSLGWWGLGWWVQMKEASQKCYGHKHTGRGSSAWSKLFVGRRASVQLAPAAKARQRRGCKATQR
jgi:hypothetical protein